MSFGKRRNGARRLNFSGDVMALNPSLRDNVSARAVSDKRLVVDFKELKSHLEEQAWLHWIPSVERVTGQRVIAKKYEPFGLKLTGGVYTPDIFLRLANGETWVVEVKGSWKAHQSGRMSKRNLKQASIEMAGVFDRFFALMPKGAHDWTLYEVVEGDFIELKGENWGLR